MMAQTDLQCSRQKQMFQTIAIASGWLSIAIYAMIAQTDLQCSRQRQLFQSTVLASGWLEQWVRCSGTVSQENDGKSVRSMID